MVFHGGGMLPAELSLWNQIPEREPGFLFDLFSPSSRHCLQTLRAQLENRWLAGG